MKKTYLTIMMLVFAGLTLLVNCRNPAAQPAAKILSVTLVDAAGAKITAEQINGTIGNRIQFGIRIKVDEPNKTSYDVQWDVSGHKSSSTSIDETGLLRIGTSETNGAILTVTVTSKADASKSATVKVKCVAVTNNPDTPGEGEPGEPVEPGENPHFAITINNTAGGVVSSDKKTAARGDTVTLTIEPDAGYEVSSLNVIANTVVTFVNAATRTFSMPAGDVTIEASWRLDPWGGSYVLYSNGEFHENVDVQWPFGQKDPLAEDGGGHSGTKAIKGDAINLFAKPGFAVNLSKITGVSFWAKASRDNTLIEDIGFGRDRETSNVSYRIQIRNNTIVGTEWQRVIIPLPQPRSVFCDELFFIFRAVGSDLWLDDIELLTTPVTGMKIIMPELDPINGYPTTTHINGLLKGIKFEYSYEGIDEKGYLYDNFNFVPWLGTPYISEFTGDVVREGNYIRPAEGGSAYTMSISLSGISNSVEGEITPLQDWVIEDFVNAAKESGYWFWHAGWWGGFGNMGKPDDAHSKPGVNAGFNERWMGYGRRGQNWDLRPFTKISFYIAVELPNNATWKSSYRFSFEVGKYNTEDHKLFLAPEFDGGDVNNSWKLIELNLSDFIEEESGSQLTEADLAAITGWELRASTWNAPAGQGEWAALAEIKAVVR